MTLTDEVLADLEAKAREAEQTDPGPWMEGPGLSMAVSDVRGGLVARTSTVPALRFIAATDPDTVAALVAEVRASRKLVTDLTQQKDGEYDEATRDAFRAARLATLAECEKEAQAEADDWQARLNFDAGAGALKTRDRIRALMFQPAPTPKVTP